MQQQRWQTWITRGMAIALVSSSPFLSLQATAQTSNIDCVAERQQVTEAQVFNQLNAWNQYLNQTDPRNAATALAAAFRTARSLNDAGRVSQLSMVFLDQGGQSYSQWQLWVKTALENGNSQAVTRVLADAATTAQSISSAYSYAKTQLLTAIANTYIQIGDMDEAQVVLNQALQASQTIQGDEFKTNALTPIAEAFTTTGNTEQAIAVLQQSQAAAERVNHPTYPSRRGRVLAQVAIAYVHAGDRETASTLAESIANDTYNRGSAFLALVQDDLSQNRLDAALTLANSIEHPSFQAMAIAAVATEYARQGNLEWANSQMADAVSLVRGDDVTLRDIIRQYAAADPSGALTFVELLPSPEFKLNALTSIMTAYQQAGQSDQVSLITDEMLNTLEQLESDWRGFAVISLVDEIIAAEAYSVGVRLTESVDSSLAFYNRDELLGKIAVAAAQQGEEEAMNGAIAAINPNNLDVLSKVLSAIAKIDVQDNQIDRALELVDRINTDSSAYTASHEAYQIRVLAAIASEVYRIGGIDPATPLFEDAVQRAESLSRAEDKILALGAIAFAYREGGQSTQAMDMINQLEAIIPSISDEFNASILLKQLVEQFSAADQHELALQVAQFIPEESQRSYILNTAISEAINSDFSELTLPILTELTSPETIVRYFLQISERLAMENQTERSQYMLKQALDFAQTIPDPENRVLTFGADGGTVVDDDSDRGSLLESIALRYAQMGNSDEAFRVSNLIQDETNRERLQQRLQCWAR
jgi:tetratricopeptide (TPR) repeat protein